MAFSQTEAQQRLRACGLTATQSAQIAQLVQRWISCNKEQYAVDRIKDMKVALARHFAGLDPLPAPAFGDKGKSWIKTHKGIPTGPFGVLFRMSKVNFWKAWNAMMVYTGVMFLDPDVKATPAQISKMRGAVLRADPDVDAMIEGLRMMKTSPLRFPGKGLRIGRSGGDPLVKFQFSETRRAPHGLTTLPEREAVVPSVDYLIARPYWTASRWHMIAPTLEGISNYVRDWIELLIEDDQKSGPEWDLEQIPQMGTIALIPEPGMKLRFAANPGRVYQSLTGPLGRKLFGALRRVPNDFTYDQEAGIRFVQRKLAEGKPSVSMDLSNATDNFPLELELAWLADQGVEPEWLHLFRDLCRGDWAYQVGKAKGSRSEWLHWTVGSPLGVYPTFAAFALAHHALVQSCFQEAGRQPGEDGSYDYAIVGDDCTILDREVAVIYRKVMTSLGVPISESKTLDADHTSEFLGRIITPTEVYQGFKWKGKCSDYSFVDLARNLGPSALILMRKRQRDVIRVIAPLPEPLGLGWNPMGISWSKRVGPWLDELLKESDERVRSFRSARRHTNQLLRDTVLDKAFSYNRWWVDGEILTSDQDVLRLYPTYLPGWSGDHWGEEVWYNILEVARSRGNDPESEAEFAEMLRSFSSIERSKDVPTLVQWERRIRRILTK
jgi:hypothetical protein